MLRDLPAAPRRLERACAARPRRATRSSGSARSPSCRPTSRATSTTCTASARPSATGSPPRSPRPRSGSPRYYKPPLHLQPALRYLGYSEGDLPETEKAARENLCLPLWGGISRGAAGRGRRRAAARLEPRAGVRSRSPSPGTASGSSLADAALIVRGVVARVLPPLRPGRAALLPAPPLVAGRRGRRRDQARRRSSLFGFYNRWWRYVSTRDMWGAARGVTVACLAHRPRALRVPARAHLAAAAARSSRSTSCSCSRSSPGTRLLARTLIERPQRGPRRARQGGADRRRRRRGAARSSARCSATAQLAYTPIGFVDDDPRKKNLRIHGVRVLGTTDELARILREQPARTRC